MSTPTQILEIHPLGGIDQRWRVSGRAAARVEDLAWSNRGSWYYAGGFRSIIDDYDPGAGDVNAFDSHGRIESLHGFAQHSGARRWLIWETDDGEIQAFSGAAANGTPSSCWYDLARADGTTYNAATAARTPQQGPNAGSSSVVWGDRLYLVNGMDEALVFNGRYLERAGFAAAPGAPDISLLESTTTLKQLGLGAYGGGTGEDRICAYRWKVRFVGERGQVSPWSEASAMLTFANAGASGGGTARHIVQVSLPQGPRWAIGREVARTPNLMDSNGEPLSLGQGEYYYLLTIIPDNITEAFEDGVPDAALGTLIDDADAGPWPRDARYLANFKGSMFALGRDNQLRFSAPRQPENFPPDNVIDLGDRGGAPTGLILSRNALVVFKERAIWLVKGDPVNGFYAQPMTTDTGCAAPRSIRDVPGLGLVFLAADGIYLLEGGLDFGGAPTRVVNLSVQIPDLVADLNPTALHNARAAIYHADREYWLAVPRLGSAENNLTLVYHYEIGAWSTRTGFPISCIHEADDAQGHLYFGSHDTSDPGIHVYTRGVATKGTGGGDVSPLYETAPHDFGQLYRSFRPHHVNVQAIAYSDHNLLLDYRMNRKLLQIRAASDDDGEGRDQQDPCDPLDNYGERAIWGTSLWARRRPVILRYDICTTHQEPTRELQVTLQSEERRVELVSIAIEIAAVNSTIKAMHEGYGPAMRGS